jgi:hypothetical protein
MDEQLPVFQVVFRDSYKPSLEMWLRAHGMMLVQLPQEVVGEDDLVTYVIYPIDVPQGSHV